MQFLRILFRMLIRLLEVDVYDEEEINASKYLVIVLNMHYKEPLLHIIQQWQILRLTDYKLHLPLVLSISV